MAYRIFSGLLTFRSILSHQEKTQDDASNIGYHRQITGNLGRGSTWVRDIHTLDRQKRDIGIEHHRCLLWVGFNHGASM